MNNAYEYLGLSRNAGEQQAMDAYRSIAASIHNSSMSEAEKDARMNELNAAYDAVLNDLRGQGSYSNINNSTSQNVGDSQFSDVRQRINSGRVDDAEVILDGIPTNMRNAEWHYLKGVIHQRRGWINEAYRCYGQACSLDPSNNEYRNAYNSLNYNATGGYRTSGKQENNGCTGCKICSALYCADCCCECMGGDLISCC